MNNYTYDGDGRLCSVQNALTRVVTGYTYDAEGIRVSKGTQTSPNCTGNNGFTANAVYLVGLGGEQVTELNGSGAWQHSNVFAHGALIATYDGKGTHFHFNDILGSRRVQANMLGQIEERCTSLPFGDSLSCTQTALSTSDDATEQHFTGKERDAESGLDYFGARYYSSTGGIFISPDWSSSTVPVPYANLKDPQSLNLYSYVENNPVTHTDLTGHVMGPMTHHDSCMSDACQRSDNSYIADVDGTGSGETALAEAKYVENMQSEQRKQDEQTRQSNAIKQHNAAQQQSSSDAKTAKINSRAQSQYNNDVPIIAKQLGVSADEVRDSVHIDYDANGRAVVVGGHVNMTVDDGSDAQSALAARLGPGPHGYNENAATGQGQGSEFSRLGTSPSVHLDGGLLHVDRFNASAWGGLGVVPHFFYDVAYGHMQGSSNPMLPY